MQAIAPKPEIETAPGPPTAADRAELAPAHAVLSLRAVSALEIASVITSVLLTTWALIPLQPRPAWLIAAPGLLAAGLMIHSHRVRGEGWRELGFTTRHFGRALRLVLPPTLAACGVFALIGYLTGSFHRTTHFWSNMLFVPVWALVQQYVLQGFIYRRLREVLATGANRPGRATLCAAAIFALVHAPNLSLMTLTFLGALIWSWVYERAPNLFALGLSHAAISLMLMTALPSWLLESMSVGYKHFLYQKF
jgi:membrane protease YdiL (CAAX protease family)